ncbi:DUF397 domain-containing protein [Streptosporangium sp. DT93]|uniref:DUF397 domain-containing protein n=1 Tax=Streptosporangium sp. DT93 TaxID=3393428 RepID=UPI003CF3DDD0
MTTGLDLSKADWKKSSLSGDSGGNCVEVADNLLGVVAVRDSKNPTGPALVLTSGDWVTFLTALKSDHFN